MKQAVLGYEQKFFINGTQMSGVQSVNGSYGISEKPINVLGWGHATGLNALSAPLEGQFSINSALVSEDFFLQFTGDVPFTGSINHGRKYYGFGNGYITSHSVNCAVGQIPTTSTSIKVFGDMGGSPDFLQVGDDGSIFLQEDGTFGIATEGSVGNQNYNASGSNPFPTIRVPNQGSMTVECAGATTDRVTSFNHAIEVPISPIYTVGSSVPAQVDVVWPISCTTSFSLDIDKYNYTRLRSYLTSPTIENIAIKINDSFGSTIQDYTVKDARLISEQMDATAEGRLTVNLEYKSYYNKR